MSLTIDVCSQAGVGTRVFRMKEAVRSQMAELAVVSNWRPGHADIEQEFTCSAGNQRSLLHDFMGFEPGTPKPSIS